MKKKSKKKKWIFICVCILVFSFFIIYRHADQDEIVDYGEPLVLEEGELAVSFLSVGQGDCIVVRLDGKVMVIDTGDSHAGESIVEYLHKNKINTLDYLVLTHPDIDHIGGATNVMKSMYIKKLLMPHMSKTTWTYMKTGTTIKTRRVLVDYPSAGQVYPFGDATVEIIGPEKVVQEQYNNSSLVLKLVYKEKSFIFSADAEKEAEAWMVKEHGEKLQCDVLKLGHHGSFTATTEEYLALSDPTWAVVSCGRWNIYGHPHTSVMKKVKQQGVQVVRTDQQGTVTALCDGESIRWKCEYNLK